MTVDASTATCEVSEPVPLLRVENLEVHFPVRGRNRPPLRAVDGVSLAVDRGETLGLVGESGSGKTTLGRAMVGLYPPTAGRVELSGIDLSTLRGDERRRAQRTAQMVFQDPFSSLNPRLSVGRMLEEPLIAHGLGSRRERHDEVRRLLAIVGLEAEHAGRYPHEFSGGQRQRIGIARALAVRPKLVVCDEPVSALDVSIQAQIMNLLVELQQEFGLAYVFVAHDLAVVHHISDRVAVMYLGRVVELASRDDLYAESRHPYSRALLSAVPVPDPRVEPNRQRIILHGDVKANPTDFGCSFRPRCWLWRELGKPERCRAESPPLAEVTERHSTACHFAEQMVATTAGEPA